MARGVLIRSMSMSKGTNTSYLSSSIEETSNASKESKSRDVRPESSKSNKATSSPRSSSVNGCFLGARFHASIKMTLISSMVGMDAMDFLQEIDKRSGAA